MVACGCLVVGSRAYRIWSKIDTQRIAGMEWPGRADQHLREIEDAPVVVLVGVGQCRARYLAAEPQMVLLARGCLR